MPPALARFDPADWPAAACAHAALDQWVMACLGWLEAQPDSLPFGQHGGWLDVFRAAVRIALELPPCACKGHGCGERR